MAMLLDAQSMKEWGKMLATTRTPRSLTLMFVIPYQFGQGSENQYVEFALQGTKAVGFGELTASKVFQTSALTS